MIEDVPAVTGSSPLTRGNRSPQGALRERRGLIPAHAGKTAAPLLRSKRKEAHPRSRGENEITIDQEKSFDGSSPLTRGKQGLTALVIGAVRLIPAHAGKTWDW